MSPNPLHIPSQGRWATSRSTEKPLISKRAIIRLFQALFCLITFSETPVALSGPVPFEDGEKLLFEVSWGIIPSGKAVLRVEAVSLKDGRAGYHFSAEASTYPLIDLIYKVRDRVDSFTDKDLKESFLYRVEKAGRRKKLSEVTFDLANLKAQYREGHKAREPIDIRPGSLDPLSIFYAFRLQRLSEGIELSSPVTDGKRCVTGNVKVLRKEKISVPAGSFETYLVEPDLKHVRGIFEKSPGARLFVWVTADGRAIPVRIKSKVIVGSFVAELVSIEKEASGVSLGSPK